MRNCGIARSSSWSRRPHLDVARPPANTTIARSPVRHRRSCLVDSRGIATGGDTTWAYSCRSSDTGIRRWDPHTGAQTAHFGTVVNRVASLAYSPDGGALLSGSWDAKSERDLLRLWDVRNQAEVWAKDSSNSGSTSSGSNSGTGRARLTTNPKHHPNSRSPNLKTSRSFMMHPFLI